MFNLSKNKLSRLFTIAKLIVFSIILGFFPSSCKNTKNSALVSISISPINSNILINSTQQYTAIGTYFDHSTKDLTLSVKWNSSNSSVTLIESNGLATGLSEGEVNITASLNGIQSNTAILIVLSADPYQECFNNSTWVVPPQTLLAYLYDNANVIPVSDQTVWVFSNYNQGYFYGQAYTSIDNALLSQKYLIGSVTSEGQVYITFYSGSSTSTDLVSGVGDLNTKIGGQCAFIMQMNSGQNGVSGLTHWSYMVPVNPGDAFYNNLPGTNMSVPEFLAQF